MSKALTRSNAWPKKIWRACDTRALARYRMTQGAPIVGPIGYRTQGIGIWQAR